MAEEEKVKLEIEVPKKALLKRALAGSGSERNEKEDNRKHTEEKPAGYEPSELLKAAIEVPDPADKRPPNPHQLRVMLMGLTLVVISLVLLVIINFTAFVVMALAGAFIIAFGALVRV